VRSNTHCECSKSIAYVTCTTDIEYLQWISERSPWLHSGSTRSTLAAFSRKSSLKSAIHDACFPAGLLAF